MAPISARSDLFQLWGKVNQAIRDPQLRAKAGGVTQFIFESYKQSYAATGQAPPSLSIFDVNPLVSLAASQFRAETQLLGAAGTFQATGLDQAITGSMIANDIDSRGLLGIVAQPSYRVRVGALVTAEGEQIHQFYTFSTGLSAPSSISQLLDQAAQAAQGFASDYGLQFNALSGYMSVTMV